MNLCVNRPQVQTGDLLNTSNNCLRSVCVIIKLIAHSQTCFSTKILLTQITHYLVFYSISNSQCGGMG